MADQGSRNTGLGREYASLIVGYIHRTFSQRGIAVRREVALGATVIGKMRHVDVLLVHRDTGTALALECKWQGGGGTADEKMPYALQDVAAMRMPAAIVYAGQGWSRGVVHMLQASTSAVYCLPDPDLLETLPPRRGLEARGYSTWELDHLIATTFGFWDLLPAELSSEDVAKHQWDNLKQELRDAEGKMPKPAKRVDRPRGEKGKKGA